MIKGMFRWGLERERMKGSILGAMEGLGVINDFSEFDFDLGRSEREFHKCIM